MLSEEVSMFVYRIPPRIRNMERASSAVSTEPSNGCRWIGDPNLGNDL